MACWTSSAFVLTRSSSMIDLVIDGEHLPAREMGGARAIEGIHRDCLFELYLERTRIDLGKLIALFYELPFAKGHVHQLSVNARPNSDGVERGGRTERAQPDRNVSTGHGGRRNRDSRRCAGAGRSRLRGLHARKFRRRAQKASGACRRNQRGGNDQANENPSCASVIPVLRHSPSGRFPLLRSRYAGDACQAYWGY